jgi:hypothetical protein
MTRISKAGRKPATAPPGRLTLQQVADGAGLTRARVQQLVDQGKLAAELENGAWTVARDDAATVRRQEPRPRRDVKATMVRSTPERYARWAKAAGDKPVSVWLAELADAACDVSGAGARRAV